MDYVVFNKLTGEPIKWGQTQSEVLDLQAGENEVALATSFLTVEGNRLPIWEKAKSLRDYHINKGAPTPFGYVDSDEAARSNISGAVLGAVIAKTNSATYSVTWTLLDNSVVTLTADEMTQLGLAVLTHVNSCHEKARQLRVSIESATSMAELLAIDVNVGWPS